MRYIAVVRWTDPATYTDWVSVKKAQKKKATEIVSVGMFINEDKDYVRIALDTSADKSFNGVGVIPKRCIIGKVKKIPLPATHDV